MECKYPLLCSTEEILELSEIVSDMYKELDENAVEHV
jgi:hypothetical protein